MLKLSKEPTKFWAASLELQCQDQKVILPLYFLQWSDRIYPILVVTNSKNAEEVERMQRKNNQDGKKFTD